MKKVINLVLAVLTVGTLNAQWTLHETGTSKYTATTEDDGATAVLQNIDSKIVLHHLILMVFYLVIDNLIILFLI